MNTYHVTTDWTGKAKVSTTWEVEADSLDEALELEGKGRMVRREVLKLDITEPTIKAKKL